MAGRSVSSSWTSNSDNGVAVPADVFSNEPDRSKPQPPAQGLRAAPAKSVPLPVDTRLDIALRAAINQKALDARALDVAHATDIADRFIIVSGTSERHVRGISDKVAEALARVGEEPASISGYDEAEWILLDYGDLVVHVFYEPTRQYYDLEDVWQKRGKVIPPAPDLEAEVRRLRTGIGWGGIK